MSVPWSSIIPVNYPPSPFLFDLDPSVALGDAEEKVNQLARTILPATISANYAGTAQAFQDSVKGLGILLIMAILFIYMVLGFSMNHMSIPLPFFLDYLLPESVHC